MAVLKVTTVGNSVGVILPKELLERLRVGKGDSLYVIETKQGIELTPYNPEFAGQMEAAERVMRERGLARSTTKEIAREAGFSEGALYKHFESKEDLFVHVLAERLPPFVDVLGGCRGGPGVGRWGACSKRWRARRSPSTASPSRCPSRSSRSRGCLPATARR